MQNLVDQKTKPLGSLGKLERLACDIAVLQQTSQPKMARCELIIFIADHGIVAEGVSAFPQAVTAQMAANFLAGGAAANVFANVNGIDVMVVNAGMAEPVTHENLVNASVGLGTHNFRLRPAMTTEQAAAAVETGEQLGSTRQADALCFGEMGIGNTSAASMLLHKILDIPLEQLVGRGTGIDDTGLHHKAAVLSEAAARVPGMLPAQRALCEYGGFEIAMMAGAMLGAARSGTVIVVDGFIATAAAVVAQGIDPTCKKAMVFSHCSAESGHAIALQHLGVTALLDLGLRLGEGTGAILAWPLLKSAVAMLNDMASFESAQVDNRVEPT